MRKLKYSVDMEHFEQIKKDIVPSIFTKHQFNLIKRKFSGKVLTDSEKNEFSRTVSKKMNAIYKIIQKETDGMFVYGKEKMIPPRLKQASDYIKKFSRKFKNRHVIITGSFLCSESYNDIDIFVISKYEKEDYKTGDFHINYLSEDVYSSLFFESVRKLCISNKEIRKHRLTEKIDIHTFISIYQELFNDVDKKFKGVGFPLREFLLQACFIGRMSAFDSLELKQKTDKILRTKNPKEIIKNIFVNSIVMGSEKRQSIAAMKKMISSYKKLIGEYRQHKDYYIDLMSAFEKVIAIES